MPFRGDPRRAGTADLVQRFEQIATLIRDNRIAEAEKELDAVLQVAPDLPVALNLMGTIRAKQGRLNEAELLFLRAVRNDKKFTGARMNLVYLYLLKRAPEKSIVQLKEILAVEPEHAEANEKLAELLVSQGRFDECISFIEKQKHSRSVPPSLLVVLGDAYLAKNRLPKAEENYLTRARRTARQRRRVAWSRADLALEGRGEGSGDLFESRRESCG